MMCEKGKIRIIDAWDPTRLIAIEAKTGRQRASKFIQRQILKDAFLQSRGRTNQVEWHFLPNASGDLKVDPQLLAYLDDPNTIPANIIEDVFGPAGLPPGTTLDPIPYEIYPS